MMHRLGRREAWCELAKAYGDRDALVLLPADRFSCAEIAMPGESLSCAPPARQLQRRPRFA